MPTKGGDMQRILFVAVIGVLCSQAAHAQVQIEITNDQARQAQGATYLSDLAVHDIAFLYNGLCTTDSGLYIPGWQEPTSFDYTWKASGIVLRVVVLPGKRLKAAYVEARQAQLKATGAAGSEAPMSKADYNHEVRDKIAEIFEGERFFSGTSTCDELERNNPLRHIDFYAVQSINGFTKLSDLVASVKAP
jgi:hypothetical protein